MAGSRPVDPSTAYDPFLISEHQGEGGLSRSYIDAMNDKQGFVSVGGAVPMENSSGKVSKSSQQFHELEIPRPHSAMLVKAPTRKWVILPVQFVKEGGASFGWRSRAQDVSCEFPYHMMPADYA